MITKVHANICGQYDTIMRTIKMTIDYSDKKLEKGEIFHIIQHDG